MDENRAAEFTGRVLADSAAAATIVLAALGDRTGLFKDLAGHGPATSGELASRTGLAERYVREWLGGMFAAGYLTYEALPPELGLDRPGRAGADRRRPRVRRRDAPVQHRRRRRGSPGGRPGPRRLGGAKYRGWRRSSTGPTRSPWPA